LVGILSHVEFMIKENRLKAQKESGLSGLVFVFGYQFISCKQQKVGDEWHASE